MPRMDKKMYICLSIHIFLLPNLILSKENIPNDIPKQNKLGECLRCKVYSDSFKNWFEKTSRGKFEGGDTDWEEKKLKSYAHSEVRLVEIQEKLCSDLHQNKDECYSIAEDAEHLVEKWWTEQNIESSDLYTWLCIDNLKYCCPSNHFGELCTPCPLDTDGKICNEHGTCSGVGTRKGNGSCICDTGYSGETCSECASNYFSVNEDECLPCHRACEECFSYGTDKCKECAKGWELKDGICIDIDECTPDTVCKSNQYCVNKEGSYACKLCHTSCLSCEGYGPYNCTLCKPNFLLWSGKCLNEKVSNELLLNADKRLFLYISLNILMYLFYQKAKPLAIVMGTSLSILIFKLEHVSDITVKDTIQHHLINFLKANELM